MEFRRTSSRLSLAFVFVGIFIISSVIVLYVSPFPESVKSRVEPLYDAALTGHRPASRQEAGIHMILFLGLFQSSNFLPTLKYFLRNSFLLDTRCFSNLQYAVIDFLWYRRHERGASVASPGYDVIDEWGRPNPDPVRWPSSVGGKGFKAVADRVHEMGLKFGIHVMRGISTQAVKANTYILGSQGFPYEENGKIWRAKDIALSGKKCAWMSECFMSVDTEVGAGRAFIQSLYRQYADWGVDLVKHDCVFGQDLNIGEISLVSQILKDMNRPIVYSISPGKHATPDMALEISKLVNMYRITADDWDSWKDIRNHFDVSRDFAERGLIGSQGLLGRSWPDLDMLPFSRLTDPNANEGPHRSTKLLPQEQKVQMTLWAMARSPIMFGGDLRHIDNATMALITNPTLLEINANSTLNQEFHVDRYNGIFQRIKPFRVLMRYFLKVATTRVNNIRTWMAKGPSGELYIAAFNLGAEKVTLYLRDDVKIYEGKFMTMRKKDVSCSYFDVWKSQNIEVDNNVRKVDVPSHGTSLLILKCY